MHSAAQSSSLSTQVFQSTRHLDVVVQSRHKHRFCRVLCSVQRNTTVTSSSRSCQIRKLTPFSSSDKPSLLWHPKMMAIRAVQRAVQRRRVHGGVPAHRKLSFHDPQHSFKKSVITGGVTDSMPCITSGNTSRMLSHESYSSAYDIQIPRH